MHHRAGSRRTPGPSRAARAPLAGLLLAGCVAMVPYPVEWAPPQPAPPGCGHLTGLYENWGERATPASLVGSRATRAPARLASLFATARSGYPRDGGGDVRRVRIDARTAGRLEVTLYRVDDRARVLGFDESAGDFACQDGRLRLDAGEFGAGYLAIGGSSETRLFSRAADGALIVELQERAAGTAMLVIPMVGASRGWARFDAVPD